MREFREYRSVRGALSNERPYREPFVYPNCESKGIKDRNRSHPLPLTLSVAAGSAFV